MATKNAAESFNSHSGSNNSEGQSKQSDLRSTQSNKPEHSNDNHQSVPAMTRENIDREGFNIVDAQYNKEVWQARQEVTQKWDTYYSQKHYHPVNMKDAKKRDKQDRLDRIEKDLAEREARIGKFHFGEGGRSAALERLGEKESQERTERINQEKQQAGKKQQRSDFNQEFRDESTGYKHILKQLKATRHKRSNNRRNRM